MMATRIKPTLMAGGPFAKHFLYSIVETCQTVTTQKGVENALRKPVPVSDIIEARQEGLPPPPVLLFEMMLTVVIAVAWI